MTFHRVCLLSEISAEKQKKYVVNGIDVLIVKSSDNRIWAFQYFCSHADKPLLHGKWDPVTAQITCPFHLAVFALAESGAVKAPPAFAPLEMYAVEVRRDGLEEWVYVEV